MKSREAGAQPAFPPNVVVEVKRIACERPMDAGVPLAGCGRDPSLTPNDFASLATLEHYLMAFQHRYQGAARPFRWTFTRADLQRLLTNLATAAEPVRPAA